MKKLLILWIAFILGCSIISSVYSCDANSLLNLSDLQKSKHPSGKLVQKHLDIIYQHDVDWKRDKRLGDHAHLLTDGIIGPVTLFWLKRFACDFKIEPKGNYIHKLFSQLHSIASFAKKYPIEKSIVLSDKFSDWIEAQPIPLKYTHYNVMQSGTHQEIIDLVKRYREDTGSEFNPLYKNGNELTTYTYQLTAEDFKILKDKEKALQQITQLEYKSFDDESTLSDAVTAIYKDYPEQVKELLPIIKRYYKHADTFIDKGSFHPVINKAFLDILMGDPSFISLNSVIANLLERELGDMAYPDKSLFDNAVQAKIKAGIGACYSKQTHNQYISSLRIGDEDYKKLKEHLLIGNYYGMPKLNYQLKQIDRLRSRPPGSCDVADIKMIDEFVADFYEHIVWPSIAALYEKKPVFNKSIPIHWNGEGCGCVLDQLSGTVYGFYPFWSNDREKEQIVNFSVLSRVAYYGLTFDEKGMIRHANNGINGASSIGANIPSIVAQNDFVQVARKHNSKVDWVIHNDKRYWDTWKTYTSTAKADTLEALTDNIVNLLTSQLNDKLSKTKRYMTFGLSSSTPGDGVTLYFNGYPEDLESIDLFNSFFKKLRKKLDEAGGENFVNIMIQQTALDKGIYRYDNLFDLIRGANPAIGNSSQSKRNPQYNLTSKVIVLINEPTADSKKILRFDIESSGLLDVHSGLLLKNIIPVIGFDGKNWEQLQNDLDYFKDNFGGVGFWPLDIIKSTEIESSDMARCSDIKAIDGCLVRHFQEVNHGQPDSLGKPDSWLDKFVCENRWYFYVSLILFLAICLFIICSFVGSCYLRKKIEKYLILCFFISVIPAFVLVLLLLKYDPVFEPWTRDNWLLILGWIGVAVTLAAIIFNYRPKARMKLPSRQSIASALQ